MITLVKANKELKKVVDYLEENKSAWNERRNLKLYDAAFYNYKEDFPLTFKKYRDNEFNKFCESKYHYFTEWLDEEEIDKNILHGITSFFYIGKYGNNNIVDILGDIYSNGNAFDYINISFDYKITPFGKWELTDDEVQDELNYIVSNLFDDVKAVFEPIIKVANYIDDFKENQLDYFKEYLSYEEDNLQAEKENRDAEIEANNKKVSILINKVKSVITLDELDMINRLYIKEEE